MPTTKPVPKAAAPRHLTALLSKLKPSGSSSVSISSLSSELVPIFESTNFFPSSTISFSSARTSEFSTDVNASGLVLLLSSLPTNFSPSCAASKAFTAPSSLAYTLEFPTSVNTEDPNNKIEINFLPNNINKHRLQLKN